MSQLIPPDHLEAAYQTALAALLAERTPEGHWVGELSTSALSTAVAVSALATVQKTTAAHGTFDSLIVGGLEWLVAHQNADGGWGDTIKSVSNISTTMLARSAFHITDTPDRHPDSLRKADDWLASRYGTTPEQVAEAVRARYGKDRTFSVPILMTSALAGLVPWREVPPLPFELACFPQSWFRLLSLRVVSYALPALIAIGQAVYHHRRPWNPLTRLVRRMAIRRSLRVLESIQPTNGGFLEATPLTAFVTLGLASSGKVEHPVVARAVSFLRASVRPDGSWPIDTNLSTWVTTLAVNALAAAGELDGLEKKEQLRGWLLKQQYLERHPYTGADPGAWAWTPLPGGVPDADDTPGALLALDRLTGSSPRSSVDDFVKGSMGGLRLIPRAATWCRWYHGIDLPDQQGNVGFHILRGLWWLLCLRNRDGGWPTFCRGWGALPFDRSGTDLTAHALRALRAWQDRLTASGVMRVLTEGYGVPVRIARTRLNFPAPSDVRKAMEHGLAYLARQQRADGSWLPLWFGNQHAADEANPTYGTARVLAAYRDLHLMDTEPARRGVAWLLSAQNADGGWGGDRGMPSSVEETSLALDVLVTEADTKASDAVSRGLAWLIDRVEAGGLHDPTPIGFYFAKLWYFEKMYPLVFAVAALGRARLAARASLGTPTRE